MSKILVTGGAGYIGSVLVRFLLERGYEVKVIDKLLHGGEPILGLLNNPRFQFICGDIRQKEDVKLAMTDVKTVIHLAAIVGDPACSKDSELAKSTNLDGSYLLFEEARKVGISKFIFASTCSNYGVSEEEYADETSELNPVSIYAETKVEFENFLLSETIKRYCDTVCLRFATAYGLSPRMRFDLTVNDFTRDLFLGNELVIFGEQFWRPYCHTNDISRAITLAVEDDRMNDVFNVGDSSENYQKKTIASLLVQKIPNAKIKYIQKDEDLRNYRVNFDKIKKLGFSITKKVSDGIDEILQTLQLGFYPNLDDEKYMN